VGRFNDETSNPPRSQNEECGGARERRALTLVLEDGRPPAPLRREMREGCATLAKHLSSEQGGQFGLDCRLDLAFEGKRDERERDFNGN
jgi:hypothetical protein